MKPAAPSVQEHRNTCAQAHRNMESPAYVFSGPWGQGNISTQVPKNRRIPTLVNTSASGHSHTGLREDGNIGAREHGRTGTRAQGNSDAPDHGSTGTSAHRNIGAQEHRRTGTWGHGLRGAREHEHKGTVTLRTMGTRTYGRMGTGTPLTMGTRGHRGAYTRESDDIRAGKPGSMAPEER